jgi:Protein of unknown function (DUF4235)
VTEIDEAEQKSSLARTLGATIAGILAVKLVTYLVTTGWRLATKEEPPQADESVPIRKKALWIGLIGAATGAARQAARDYIKPPQAPPG